MGIRPLRRRWPSGGIPNKFPNPRDRKKNDAALAAATNINPPAIPRPNQCSEEFPILLCLAMRIPGNMPVEASFINRRNRKPRDQIVQWHPKPVSYGSSVSPRPRKFSRRESRRDSPTVLEPLPASSQATISLRTLPATSVKRKSRPA